MGKPGKFFVFEGIDGSGKSTQMSLLAKNMENYVEECGKVRQTCEPTGGPIGSLLRQMLSGRISADPRVIAQLFAADRVDHLTNSVDGILDCLARGETVLCDRYYLSSYAYQSGDMPMEEVAAANATALSLLLPTATIYIEVSAETSMARIEKNRDKQEIFENFQRLQNTLTQYEKAFALCPEEKILRINGEQSPEKVAEDVISALLPFLEEDS